MVKLLKSYTNNLLDKEFINKTYCLFPINKTAKISFLE